MSEKTSNPAVVGLAGFGSTTLLLQFHNLGWCSAGPVFWLAIFFGGLAQLIAGLQEFRTGNNYGFAAFTTYGAFWLALAGLFASSTYKFMPVSTTDIGWFLVIFTFMTLWFFIGAMKQNTAISLLFLTLFLGYLFLDISHLTTAKVFTTIAAIDLIITSFIAYYMMMHVAFAQLGWNLSVGKPWIKSK